MKRFLPKSLAGQTILVLLMGLTISHIISMAIYSSDRVEALSMAGGHSMAQRIANVSHLIAQSPVEWREKIVSTLDEPSFQVFVSPKSALIPRNEEDLRTTFMRDFMESQLRADSVGNIIVQLLDDPVTRQKFGIESSVPWMQTHLTWMPYGIPPHQSLRISIELDDGAWLNFSSAIPEAVPFWSKATILSMLSMGVAVILLSVWVVRRLTTPLGRFAQAAERLGKDVNAPPLPESGSIELQQASRAFNQMQQRLRRIIENRTRMLAAISHDLRTPITLLRLRTELFEDNDERKKIFATLDDMESMISSTMAFAREEAKSEESQIVDVGALLESICNDMSDGGLPVQFEKPDRFLLKCRKVSMKRAFTNLLNNAVKYGGNAVVSITNEHDTLDINIEDNGPGIPAIEMEKVFDPFYRLESSRNPKTGGIGLGLSIARSVIQAHGGELILTNRPEGGLSACVSLPF